MDSTEDPLALLPRTPLRRYGKNQVIYGPQERVEALYLIVDGRVKISRPRDDWEVALAFLQKDDFLGDAVFLGLDRQGEQATALAETSLMAWPIGELKRLLLRTPALGPAFLRYQAQKLSEANARIESLCLDPLKRRLVAALLYMGQRVGQPGDDRFVHILPVTHEQLSSYLGTSRELVTQYMNLLRREGLLRYSRRGLDLNLPALQGYLQREAGSDSDRIPPVTA
jgi:CRP-like cAMP-binding protein